MWLQVKNFIITPTRSVKELLTAKIALNEQRSQPGAGTPAALSVVNGFLNATRSSRESTSSRKWWNMWLPIAEEDPVQLDDK